MENKANGASRIRTRFAPSPTGSLHVGSLRTALYNYLFAKKNNGDFLLRIEDTDQTRLVSGATQEIIDSLAWAGIFFDEGPGYNETHGPYVQSQRLPLYKKHAEWLVEQGHAYYCFCSPERLEKMRAVQIAQKLPPAYDRCCRNLTKDEVEAKRAESSRYVIRMKVPLEGESNFVDLIRGPIAIGYKVVDDQVLIKSDGFPTYHLAVVVDDHFMEISHVIRGEEWLSSTPKHLLLFSYFGWQAPHYAHLPLLLNTDRSKLSKRQGDVSVSDYRNKGYLPEALVNFIALLGWNPGEGTTQEIFTLDELIQAFTLEHVGKAGAVFDINKLNWINQQYIYRLSADEIIKRIKPMLIEKGWDVFPDLYIKQAIELLKERVTFLPDFVTDGYYFFSEPIMDPTNTKNLTEEARALLQGLVPVFEAVSVFDAPSSQQALRDHAEKMNISAGKFIQPLRQALTGTNQGPGLFDLIAVLGKDTVVRRIKALV